MRRSVHSPLMFVAPDVDHQHAKELQAIGARIESMPECVDLVALDLDRGLKNPSKGRQGLSAGTVLSAALLKQLAGLSYKMLAFHLADSRSYRKFCFLGISGTPPSESALQRDIKKIRPETFEKINRILLGNAAKDGIETGRKVRVDCTVTETNIHEPMDSEQLWDCVRVLSRLLDEAKALVELRFTDHTRRAKKRRQAIRNAKNKQTRKKLYVDLLKVTQNMTDAAYDGISSLSSFDSTDFTESFTARHLKGELERFADLSERVISQTHRRVILEEKVPAREKVFSIFEPHTDIIIKNNREVEYGHKLCLASGASGLILDLVVEDGNPADSTLATRMVERQKDVFNRAPRQVAFDGGFASKDNLREIKELGVSDVSFSKRRGLAVKDMVKSEWVYRQLFRFRAGVEAGISFLKRCFGLRRCTWSGLDSFKAYAWASVLAANLLMTARHDLA